MNIQNENVNKVRTRLGLSMDKFAEPLGVGKSAISKIESGDRQLTEQMAKAICRVYNVDYFWLTEGVGEMFTQFPSTLMDTIQETYLLDELERDIVERYLNLNPEDRKLVTEFIALIQNKKE